MAETASQDALLLLVQRVSEMQLEQGRAVQAQANTQHEISTALAVLNTRLEPLVSLTADIHQLQLRVNENTARLAQHSEAIDSLASNVDSLKGTSATRTGWEKVLGQMGMVLLGGILTLVISSLLQPAKAAGPAKKTYPPMKYEHPCWAVPAPDNRHQWLYL